MVHFVQQYDSQVVHIMLKRIAEFFRFMSENKERRLFYVLPIDNELPYAYQHSAIRDIGTICDILDLVQLRNERKLELGASDIVVLFEEAARNTVNAYHRFYEQGRFSDLPDGNIGDLGFFLLALSKYHDVFRLKNLKKEKNIIHLIVKQLIELQNSDGSLNIFFKSSLNSYSQSAEAFYLPEALLGLIAILKSGLIDQNIQIENTLQRAVVYLCKESNRNWHLASENSTFYFNWQSQLLYHWIIMKTKEERVNLSHETTHLQRLVETMKTKKIANISFASPVATVEVACYFEGLVHAKLTLEMLSRFAMANDIWFSKEIDRCLAFLYELQNMTLKTSHGGFVHSRSDDEARVDVAGHVFGGLRLLC